MASRSGKGDSRRRVDVPSADRRGTQRRGKSKSSVFTKKPKKSSKKAPPRKDSLEKGNSLLGAFVKWVVLAIIWGSIALGGVLGWYVLDPPDVDKLSATTRRPSITLLDRTGEVIATYGDLYGQPVQASEMPQNLIKAVLATEDRRFFSHFGLDVIGLTRAMWVNLKSGRIIQGGSTITQQIAKNLFLTPERTIKRKIRESVLSLWLEHRFTKEQLLTIYLNRVYLGAGTYGVEAAAAKYFGKSARNLGLYESALIAGLLKAPSRFTPTHNPELSERRTAQVLVNMVAAGFLTPDQVENAKHTKPKLEIHKAPPRSTRYFVDWLLPRIEGYIGLTDYDLVVSTTLDRTLQKSAETNLVELSEKEGIQADARQAALIVLSPDGAVRAMVGGRDYGDNQFNRTTQAKRQPGSAFKLPVYLAGLESGLSPEDTFQDAPVTVGDWSPRNYSGKYVGAVSLKEALARSINTVAVRVSEHAGRNRVRNVARRLGIISNLPEGPALALGTAGVTLIEMTGAYAALANEGEGVWPYGIREIRSGEGELLHRRAGSGPGRVIAPGNVARLHDMLGAVITLGTGKTAQIGRPVAGKTGTSQDFRDAWFIGYSTELVTGVWFGNDNNTPMAKVTGGGLPARLWREFMLAAHKGLAPRPLPGAHFVLETPEAFSTPAGITVDAEAKAEEIPPGGKPQPRLGFWDQLMMGIGIGR